jgi:hypothetical protein
MIKQTLLKRQVKKTLPGAGFYKKMLNPIKLLLAL